MARGVLRCGELEGCNDLRGLPLKWCARCLSLNVGVNNAPRRVACTSEVLARSWYKRPRRG